MQKHYNYLNIDLDKKIHTKLKAKQGDSKSRYILVNLISNSTYYDLSDCAVKIYGIKKDKTIFFNHATVINGKQGQFEVELTAQALSVPGEIEIQILILGTNQEKLTTFSFFIDVEKTIIDDTAIESTNEFTALTKALSSVQNIDNKFAKVDEQFNTIMSEDVEYNSVKYNITHFKSLALKNKSNFIKKFKLNEGVKIICRGDSLTYGEDNVVDRRGADTTTTHTGRVHTSLRANTTYPEALQEYLSLVKNVTVINQGYSGDNTMIGFSDWINDVGADLTLIMYGTNDSAFGFSPYLSIDNFIKHYEKIIIRELLRGSSVILMKPPKLKKLDGRYYTETYRQIVEELGKKYGLDVLDCAEMLINDDSSVFADYTHFKSVGYRKLASKITAFLLGNMSKPNKIKRGNTLLTREEFDGVTLKGYANLGSKTDMFTPPLDSWQGGYIAESNADDSVFIWSFYSEEDDLIVIPTLYAGRCIARFELDFGLEQPQFSLDDKVGHTTYSYQKGTTDKPISYTEFDSGVDTQTYSTRELNTKYIHIATKGWHTIKVTLKSNASTNTNKYICLNGLSFMGYEEFIMWERMKKVDGRHFMLTHTTWNSTPSSVSTLIFKRTDILDSLAWDENNNEPFKNPMMNITVYSYEKGVVEYLWNLGSLTDNSKSYLIEKGRYKIGSSSDNDLRLISSISYSNGTYTINFGGKLDVISNITIKLN